jgi:hypothetical protein
MIHAVDKILSAESTELKELASFLTHRCASIAEMHDPDEDDGPGDDIRSAFADLP